MTVCLSVLMLCVNHGHVYMCIHACKNDCICVYMHLHTCVLTHAYAYVCVHTHAIVLKPTCRNMVYRQTHVRKHPGISLENAPMCMEICLQGYVHAHAYMYTHVCMLDFSANVCVCEHAVCVCDFCRRMYICLSSE
jgi:hypothetical protein